MTQEKKLDFLHDDYDALRHALVSGPPDESAVLEREHEQDETRREAQAEVLDVESLAEFRRAREAFPLLIIESDRPLEDMTLSDYRATRQREKSSMKQPKLEMGEMTFEEFCLARKAE